MKIGTNRIYERDQLADFRAARLPALSSLEQDGVQLHRHYTADAILDTLTWPHAALTW